MQKIINENGYDVVITDEVNRSYFDVNNTGFTLKDDISIRGLIERYRYYPLPIKMFKLLDIIFDDNFIFNQIHENRCIDNKGPKQEKKLDEIINKVLTDPCILGNLKQFFIDVARNLSKEEYDYLRGLILDKTCLNCNNDKCSKRSSVCPEWDNIELVGRKKILMK